MSAQQILYKNRETYKQKFSEDIRYAANKIYMKNHYAVGEETDSWDLFQSLMMYKIMKINNCEFVDYINEKLEGDIYQPVCKNIEKKYGRECNERDILKDICSTSTIAKAAW